VINVVSVKEIFETSTIAKKAKITAIEIKKASDVFGNQARAPERQVAVIHTEYGNEAHAVPKGIEYTGKDWKVTDELQAIKSVRNPNSWFARFYKKYNVFPKEGMEVEVTVNARGFTVINI